MRKKRGYIVRLNEEKEKKQWGRLGLCQSVLHGHILLSVRHTSSENHLLSSLISFGNDDNPPLHPHLPPSGYTQRLRESVVGLEFC